MENNNIFISETFYSTRHGNKGIQIIVEDMQLNFIQGSGGRNLAPCQEHSDKDIIPGFIGNREF